VKTDAAVERTILVAGITHTCSDSGWCARHRRSGVRTCDCVRGPYAAFRRRRHRLWRIQHRGVKLHAHVQTGAEPVRWLDGRTSLTLPHVVDRWSDEPTAVD
jgi:hypothetical protein